MRRLPTWIGLALLTALVGCASSPPKGIKPVSGFEFRRYLGTWHEIARLDHPFERGLSQVTATYALRPDGSIQVVNRGYDAGGGEWREIRGVARFMGPTDVGSLSITFFWPFSGAYHVIALDREGYDYAMVTSSSRSYLWILARQPRLDQDVLDDLLAQARQWGFPTDELIFVEH